MPDFLAPSYRRNADRDDDDISMISMQEVQPTPIYDAESPDNAYGYSSSAPSTPTHRINMTESTYSVSKEQAPVPGRAFNLTTWLLRTQKYSSYTFSCFLGIHAATAAASPLLFGLDAGNSSLVLARTYFYQAHPAVEALLIPVSLAVHVGSGVALRALRARQQKARYGGQPPAHLSPWAPANISAVSKTGYLLVPLLGAHVMLLRGVPVLVDGDSSQIGLEYLAHGFQHAPWSKVLGYGFYGALVGLVSFHVVNGAAKYWRVPVRKANAVRGATVAYAAVWIGGLVSVVSSGPVRGYLGRHYDHLYKVFFRQV